MYCISCGKELPDEARFCPNCGKSISTNKENYDLETNNASINHQPRCPICGSTNLNRIGGGYTLLLLGGLPTKRAFRTFECLDCGYLI